MKIPPPSSQAGLALVVVLSFLVILSILLVTFMTVSRLDRSASRNYSQSLQAEQLGLGALDWVNANLQREIQQGSLAPTNTVTGKSIFLPKSATTSRPALVGTNVSMPNLVQRSVGNPGAFTTGFPAADYGSMTNFASALNSSTVGSSGRSISRTRWERPQLGSFPTDSVTPDWVFVTRRGPRACSDADLPILSDPSNMDRVVGRFAYSVYDVSGLLNISIAGYARNSPSAGSAFDASIGAKGSLAWADLTQLGLTQAQVDELVAWRNQKNAVTTTEYLEYANTTGPQSGFTKVDGNASASDNTFLSRQDLIAYAKLKGIDPVLPLLTTFTREIDSPSAAPATVTANNPDLAVVEIDGKPIKRFPLAKLSLLEIPDPSATELAEIQVYFGLSKAANFSPTYRHWTYSAGGGAAQPVKRLSTVAAENRRPNLFEVLLAGIPSNSLGKNAGQTIFDSGFASSESNIYHQIMRIGAAVIDQADIDSYPTVVEFQDTSGSSFQFYGIENLPYFSEIYHKLYNPSTIPSHDPTTAPAPLPPTATPTQTFIFFELWNPHRPKVTAGATPSNVQIFVNPEATWTIRAYDYNTVLSTGAFANLSSSVNIGALATYQTGQPSLTDNLGEPSTRWTTGASPAFSFNGWRLPDTFPSTDNDGANFKAIFGYSNAVFQLRYQDGSGVFRTYATFGGLNFTGGNAYLLTALTYAGAWFQNGWIDETGWPLSGPGKSRLASMAWTKSDPRTNRFGASLFQAPYAVWQPNYPMQPMDSSVKAFSDANAYNGAAIDQHKPDFYTAPLFLNSFPGCLWNNRANVDNRAPDNDGSFRPGDGYLGGADNDALRAGAAYDTSRPVILDRPFRSVGELGFVFRDQPWKTLDLFSSFSADAALLDLFCIEENTTDLRAGVLNPNTPHSSVLQSLIVGAYRDALGSGSSNVISSGAASALANDLVTDAGRPYRNVAEIVTKLANYSGITVDANYPPIKQQREAIPRALGSVAGTRTWNLLIDVVAQSGRFANSATTLADFKVDAERRYWLHVAIDRYTGQIVARQLETVYE